MATQVDIFVPLHAIVAESGEAVHSDPEQALWALAMVCLLYTSQPFGRLSSLPQRLSLIHI